MKAVQLRKLERDELLKKANALRAELREFRFKQSRGEIKNVAQKRTLKREIARVLTLLKENK